MSVAYIINIHGAHSYWKQGSLGAAGVMRDCMDYGLEMGRSVRRTGAGHIVRPRAQLVQQKRTNFAMTGKTIHRRWIHEHFRHTNTEYEDRNSSDVLDDITVGQR